MKIIIIYCNNSTDDKEQYKEFDSHGGVINYNNKLLYCMQLDNEIAVLREAMRMSHSGRP